VGADQKPVQGLGIEHLDRPFFQLIDIGGGQPNLE
jgi:hypothetical protein